MVVTQIDSTLVGPLAEWGETFYGNLPVSVTRQTLTLE